MPSALQNAIRGLGDAVTGRPTSVVGAVGDFGDSLWRHTREAKGGWKVLGVIGDVLKSPFRALGGMFNVTAWGAEHTASFGVRMTGRGVASVADKSAAGVVRFTAGGVRFVRNHPVLTGIAAVGTGIAAYMGSRRDAAEQATMAEAMEQLQPAPVPAYRLEPGEYARTVEPRLKASGEAVAAEQQRALEQQQTAGRGA